MNEIEKFYRDVNHSEKNDDKNRISILVVDDDVSVRAGLRNIFKYKYNIIFSNSGESAPDLLTRNIYCVILDIKMRDMSGFEVYSKLKKKKPNIPIVFFTAFQSEHDLYEIINKYKPDGYIAKGRDTSSLVNIVEKSVEKYQLYLENEEYKKNLVNKIKELQSELIGQERAITETHIAGGMAHEIRNTLGAAKIRIKNISSLKIFNENVFAIKSFFQIINQNENNAEEQAAEILDTTLSEYQLNLKKNIHGLKTSIEKCLDIVNRVIDYAGIHNGTEKKEIDITTIIDEIIDLQYETMQLHRIDIINKLQREFVVLGDENLLFSAFQNLILNSIDAIVEKDDSNGRIIISGKVIEDSIVIIIKDNGIGISMDNMEKIYNPFFTTKSNNNIGLGLSETKKIIKNLKGDIIFESEFGKGCICQLVFKRIIMKN